MAKAIFEFDMDSPDDEQAHLRCTKAKGMAIVLSEMYNIRKKVESHYENLDYDYDDLELVSDVLTKVFERINQEMEEQGINIEELIS